MAATIVPILTIIFQKSIHSGTPPSDWLKAHNIIVPIHKKNDKTIASIYRPVFLTSIPCNILEHFISTSIHKHLESYNILTDRQHGVRSRRSCETSLLTTIHDLTSTLDKNRQIDVILLDFSKAFDTVPLNRLLHKLDHYGTRASTHLWIKKCLTNRTQEVLVKGCKSGQVHVSSGVPQGTVLAPSSSFPIHMTCPPIFPQEPTSNSSPTTQSSTEKSTITPTKTTYSTTLTD